MNPRRELKSKKAIMGEALPPNIQELVARWIKNNPNTLWLINWIKANHQEQWHKLKNRIGPQAPKTDQWLDLTTKNWPARNQWQKSIKWTAIRNLPLRQNIKSTNLYTTLYVNDNEETEEYEQTIDAPTQATEETNMHGQTQWTIDTII